MLMNVVKFVHITCSWNVNAYTPRVRLFTVVYFCLSRRCFRGKFARKVVWHFLAQFAEKFHYVVRMSWQRRQNGVTIVNNALFRASRQWWTTR